MGEAEDIELLKQQQGDYIVPILKLLVEGKWDSATYGADSVEAVLKALNPNDTNWTARPFDEGK